MSHISNLLVQIMCQVPKAKHNSKSIHSMLQLTMGTGVLNKNDVMS